MDNCYQWWENELNQQYKEAVMNKEDKQVAEVTEDIIELLNGHINGGIGCPNIHVNALISAIMNVFDSSNAPYDVVENFLRGSIDNLLEIYKERRREKLND